LTAMMHSTGGLPFKLARRTVERVGSGWLMRDLLLRDRMGTDLRCAGAR
jgi:hypothetical protein